MYLFVCWCIDLLSYSFVLIQTKVFFFKGDRSFSRQGFQCWERGVKTGDKSQPPCFALSLKSRVDSWFWVAAHKAWVHEHVFSFHPRERNSNTHTDTHLHQLAESCGFMAQKDLGLCDFQQEAIPFYLDSPKRTACQRNGKKNGRHHENVCCVTVHPFSFKVDPEKSPETTNSWPNLHLIVQGYWEGDHVPGALGNTASQGEVWRAMWWAAMERLYVYMFAASRISDRHVYCIYRFKNIWRQPNVSMCVASIMYYCECRLGAALFGCDDPSEVRIAVSFHRLWDPEHNLHKDKQKHVDDWLILGHTPVARTTKLGWIVLVVLSSWTVLYWFITTISVSRTAMAN